MKIAITGLVGSGKSYVSKLFQDKFGYSLFSCDLIVNLAYKDPSVIEKLNDEFHVSTKDDIKKVLNDSNINKLNEIIHPFVIDYIKKIDDTNKLVFVEVPLLFETNMEDLFDFSICVTSNFLIRRFRLLNRNKKAYKSMIKLEKYQYSSKIKKAKSNYVIRNNISKHNLLKQIDKIVKDLTREK